MSSNKNLRRITLLVTAQTAHNLAYLAKVCGCRESGRVVDKLVRDRMVANHEWRTMLTAPPRRPGQKQSRR